MSGPDRSWEVRAGLPVDRSPWGDLFPAAAWAAHEAVGWIQADKLAVGDVAGAVDEPARYLAGLFVLRASVASQVWTERSLRWERVDGARFATDYVKPTLRYLVYRPFGPAPAARAIGRWNGRCRCGANTFTLFAGIEHSGPCKYEITSNITIVDEVPPF